MAKNNRRRFGDRKDGRLIRSLPAYANEAQRIANKKIWK